MAAVRAGSSGAVSWFTAGLVVLGRARTYPPLILARWEERGGSSSGSFSTRVRPGTYSAYCEGTVEEDSYTTQCIGA